MQITNHTIYKQYSMYEIMDYDEWNKRSVNVMNYWAKPTWVNNNPNYIPLTRRWGVVLNSDIYDDLMRNQFKQNQERCINDLLTDEKAYNINQ